MFKNYVYSPEFKKNGGGLHLVIGFHKRDEGFHGSQKYHSSLSPNITRSKYIAPLKITHCFLKENECTPPIFSYIYNYFILTF